MIVTANIRFSGLGEDFGPRPSTHLVVLHTTEPSDPLKTTLRDAIALTIWQDRDDTLGSYNRIICTDGVLSCVPDTNASGGIATGGPSFDPRPWLYEMLPDWVVDNPNLYAQQLSAMGRRAYFDANGWPQSIIDGFAWSILEEENRIEALTGVRPDLIVANHADFQPGDRTDAGTIAYPLVMQRYSELIGMTPPSLEEIVVIPPSLTYRPNGIVEFAAGVTYEFFMPTANPDPTTWADRIRRVYPGGSMAHVDGPFVVSPGFVGSGPYERYRITDGENATRFLGTLGNPQPYFPPLVDVAAAIASATAPLQTKINGARDAALALVAQLS